jgi:hypothetical protein
MDEAVTLPGASSQARLSAVDLRQVCFRPDDECCDIAKPFADHIGSQVRQPQLGDAPQTSVVLISLFESAFSQRVSSAARSCRY